MKRIIVLSVLLLAVDSYADMPYEQSPFWQSTENGVYSTGLFWHDRDLDGYLDMFVSNGNDIVSASEYVYHNVLGTIGTTHAWQSNPTNYSGHNAVGDINADGYPEYFVSVYIRSNWGAAHSLMFKNNGGTLNPDAAWLSPDTFHSFACDLGDIDGDGDLDIAFACGEGYNDISEPVRVYLNDGGTITSAGAWYSASAAQMMDIAWGDVDLDGDLDLACCGDEGYVWLFYNDAGVLESSPTWISTDNQSSNTLAWGDVDGDGYLELAVADNSQLGGGGKFKYYKNNSGTLSFSPDWESATGGYGSAVCWHDFDRDGDKDLAAGRWWGDVRIYENIGGNLTTSPVWISSTNTVVEEIRVADVDRDGVEEYRSTFICELKKVFYVEYYPMHWLDSIKVDDVKLSLSEYCFDLNSGWVSLAALPTREVEVFYQYSDKQDIGVSNWDGANLIFADTLPHTYEPPVEAEWLCGDADGNEIVEISDAVSLINYVFIPGAPAPDPWLTGDVDCNCILEISDAVHLINYIFVPGSPEPCADCP